MSYFEILSFLSEVGGEEALLAGKIMASLRIPPPSSAGIDQDGLFLEWDRGTVIFRYSVPESGDFEKIVGELAVLDPLSSPG
jgi:hypothetical protein